MGAGPRRRAVVGRPLTAEGQHVFATGNTCVDDKVTKYLVDLKPPPNDTKCD
jgi:hypothetical protein